VNKGTGLHTIENSFEAKIN
jgi:hypothetical protein